MTFTVLFSALTGGVTAAVFTFDAGGGWSLCLLAYSLGGALSLFAAALCHAALPDHAPTTRHRPRALSWPDAPCRRAADSVFRLSTPDAHKRCVGLIVSFSRIALSRTRKQILARISHFFCHR